MSNQDSFIDEVKEEVRRDRLFALFRRWGWLGALLVVLIVGGAAFNEWRKARAEAEAQAAGDAIIAALEIGDTAGRAAALAALAETDNATRRAVVLFLRSAADVDAGDREGALAALDAIAGDQSLPAAFRDLATVKAVIIGAGSIPAEERIARLSPLALSASGFRLPAMEQIALAEIELGRTDDALARLKEITEDAAVTQDLRRRASQLIVALGGSLTES